MQAEDDGNAQFDLTLGGERLLSDTPLTDVPDRTLLRRVPR